MERVGWLLFTVLVSLLVACGAAAPAKEEAADLGEVAGEPAPEQDVAAAAPEAAPEGAAANGRADGSVAQEAAGEAAEALPEIDEGAARDASDQSLAITRKIIYNTTVSVRVEDARTTAQELQSLAIRKGGYVSTSHLQEEYEGTYGGSVQLRVPGEQFYKVLDDLRARYEILSEQLETEEVTDQFVDLQARIENLQKVETEVQALLTHAREQGAGTDELMRLYREVAEIRGQIERLQGRLNVLQDAVALATINVRLVPPDPSGEEEIVEEEEEEWSASAIASDALADLTATLQSLSTLVIYFTIAILPLVLLILLPLALLYTAYNWFRGPQSPPTGPTSEPSAD